MFPLECGFSARAFYMQDLPVWRLQRRFFAF
jgi:hypothetical protein